MKYLIIIASVLLLSAPISAQQEAQYTQNQFNNNLILNPAYAGYGDCPRLSLRYRDQWSGFQGAPRTINAVYDMDVLNNVGLGAAIISDQVGIDKSFQAELSLNYQLPLTATADKKLAVGFKGGYSSLKSDFSQLSNVDTRDPLYDPSLYANASGGYFGLGLLYYTEKFFFGLASPRMISFENQGARTNIIKAHNYINVGYTFDVADNFEITPSLLLKHQKAAPLEADIAVNMWMYNLGVGASYRTGDAFNAMLQYQIKNVIIGYAHDFTQSGLRTVSRGGNELFVGIGFCKEKAPARSDIKIDPTDVGRTNL